MTTATEAFADNLQARNEVVTFNYIAPQADAVVPRARAATAPSPNN